LNNDKENVMFEWFLTIGISFFIVAVAWVILSIKIVGPDEIAVRIILGKAKTFLSSGLCFVPWLFGLNYLKRFTKKRIDLNFTVNFFTKKGPFPEENEGKEKGDEPMTEYGVANAGADVGLYIKYPERRELVVYDDTGEVAGSIFDDQFRKVRSALEEGKSIKEKDGDRILCLEKEHPLVELVRAGVPAEKEKLRDLLEESVTATVEQIGSQKTWKEVSARRARVAKEIEAALKSPTESLLLKVGFRPSCVVRFTIEKLTLPKEIESALSGSASAKDVVAREAAEVGDPLGVMMKKRIEEMAEQMDMHVSEVKKMLRDRPELYASLREECKQLLQDQRSRKSGSLKDFRGLGGGGGAAVAATLAELLGDALSQNRVGRSGDEGGRSKDAEKAKWEAMTPEERAQELAEKQRARAANRGKSDEGKK
jgi:hypothetical protein